MDQNNSHNQEPKLYTKQIVVFKHNIKNQNIYNKIYGCPSINDKI